MACYNYCVTYYPIDLPVDLYVRYSRCSDDTTVTELISTLETVDNLDGTYTACISVSDAGSYPTPVCVQGGLEIVCPFPGEIELGNWHFIYCSLCIENDFGDRFLSL